MKNSLLKLLVAVGLLLSTSSIAFASSYFGGGIGNASWDLKPLFGSFELEDGTAIRLFYGTRTGNFGGEMELAFSEHDWKGSGGQATHNATHFIFSGVGYFPLANYVDLYGKVGLNLWGTSVDLLGANYEGEDGIDIALGFGLNFKATDQFIIRAEYQILPGLDDGIDEGDVTQFTVNGALVF